MSDMQAHHHDRAKVMEAFGGTRGLIDSGVPSILFLLAFNVTHSLNTAVIASLSLSAVLSVIRLDPRFGGLQASFHGISLLD